MTITIGRYIELKPLAPLRRIEGYIQHPQYPAVTLEQLECGHTQTIKQDAFGRTNAVRRRCVQCQKQQLMGGQDTE